MQAPEAEGFSRRDILQPIIDEYRIVRGEGPGAKAGVVKGGRGFIGPKVIGQGKTLKMMGERHAAPSPVPR
jgi:hypothetical protein